MATYLLVHGSWHWGGCFMLLTNALASRGHRVLTPDLATHGYDPTPPGSVADMAQYTMPARRLLEAADEKVILVGHSMGGATCTYLGEILAERIACLVYLTAFMCPNGRCPNDYIVAADYLGDPAAREIVQILGPDPLGVRLDLGRPDLVRTAFYADCTDRTVAVAVRNVIPVTPDAPYRTHSATTSRYAGLRRVYVECTEDRAIPLAMQRKMQHDVPGAEIVTLTASHSPFFSQPEALAEILDGRA